MLLGFQCIGGAPSTSTVSAASRQREARWIPYKTRLTTRLPAFQGSTIAASWRMIPTGRVYPHPWLVPQMPPPLGGGSRRLPSLFGVSLATPICSPVVSIK